jgi:hypothetical protein
MAIFGLNLATLVMASISICRKTMETDRMIRFDRFRNPKSLDFGIHHRVLRQEFGQIISSMESWSEQGRHRTESVRLTVYPKVVGSNPPRIEGPGMLFRTNIFLKIFLKVFSNIYRQPTIHLM